MEKNFRKYLMKWVYHTHSPTEHFKSIVRKPLITESGILELLNYEKIVILHYILHNLETFLRLYFKEFFYHNYF